MLNRSAEGEVLVREMTHRYPSSIGWRLQLAGAEADRGRPELARQTLKQIQDDPRLLDGPDNDPYKLALHCSMAEVCCYFGTKEMAGVLYDLVKPYSHLWGNSGFGLNTFGPVQRNLGMLALRMDDLALAEAHLDQALASCDKAGSATFMSLTCLTYAKVALKRGGAGGQRRAGELLSQAESLNVRWGLDGLSVAVRLMADRAGIAHYVTTPAADSKHALA